MSISPEHGYKILGKGAYGEVYQKDNRAVKKFDCTKSFISEAMYCKYFYGYTNIVQYIEFNFESREIVYPIYDTDMHKWKNEGQTDKRKMEVLRQVTIGICGIHESKHVHCDVKPSNILIKEKNGKLEVAVADLGLVSVRGERCKSKLCTDFYKEQNVIKTTKHDIYSLAIIFLFTLSHEKLYKCDISSYESIKNRCSRIRDKKVSKVVQSMLHEDPETRPSARDVLNELWGVKLSLPIDSRKIKVEMYKSSYDLFNSMYDQFVSKYTAHRPKKFRYALVYYLSDNNIDENKYSTYITAVFYIMSLLHSSRGSGSFPHKYDDGKKEYIDDQNTKESVRMLLSDQRFIQIILMA